MDQLDKLLSQVKEPGSPLRKLCYTFAFALMGLLFVLMGFWKALVIVLFALAGLFIGSSGDLQDALRKLISHLSAEQADGDLHGRRQGKGTKAWAD